MHWFKIMSAVSLIVFCILEHALAGSSMVANGSSTSAAGFLSSKSISSEQEQAIDLQGDVTIESVNAPGLYVNVEGGQRSKGAHIWLWDNPSQSSTQWRLQPVSDASNMYTIESTNAPGRYLNVEGGQDTNGADIWLWDNPSVDSTKWRLQPVSGSANTYTIESVNAPGKYLNVEGGQAKKGAKIWLWDNPSQNSTQWHIHQAKNPNNPKVIKIRIQRHGSSVDNYWACTPGIPDPLLTSDGIAEAEAARDFVRISDSILQSSPGVAFSSQLVRTMETSHVTFQLDKVYIADYIVEKNYVGLDDSSELNKCLPIGNLHPSSCTYPADMQPELLQMGTPENSVLGVQVCPAGAKMPEVIAALDWKYSGKKYSTMHDCDWKQFASWLLNNPLVLSLDPATQYIAVTSHGGCMEDLTGEHPKNAAIYEGFLDPESASITDTQCIYPEGACKG